MAKTTKFINEGGINGTEKGVININSKDYKGLQAAVLKHSDQQSKHDKIRYKIISLKLQMKTYLAHENPTDLKSVGSFLKEFIQALALKNKEFASFIELEESNLSSILGGRRKINTELALILGLLFDLDPKIWLAIQNKNELLQMEKAKAYKLKRFSFERLLKEVS